MDIALISTPWPLFDRPSIQLGTLKAFVRKYLPKVRAKTYHAYLDLAAILGYDVYAPISGSTWLSESPYASLLHPQMEGDITSFWHRHTSGIAELAELDFKDLCARIKEVSDRVVEEIVRNGHPLVGLSICYGQLTSALYFLQRIKEQSPETKILVGGSSCAGTMGARLVQAISEIDFVISGEGELPFIHLIKWMASGASGRPDPMPGLITRDDSASKGQGSFTQVPDLEQIPAPDYDDYFAALRRLPSQRAFFPKLPLELSRGCYWQGHVDRCDTTRGCAFCNLNIQWQGYRTKTSERAVKEIDFLSRRYQALSLSFTDNLLPPRDLEGLFEDIVGLGKDFRLFAEVRAGLSRAELRAMGKAGVQEVQVGIEALGTGLLRKMAKGTTAIENLEIMKNCEARGTPNLAGNLILEFPGSDVQDVAETLSNLEFALPFRPLKAIEFWLGYGSPVWRNHRSHGIKKVYNHRHYRHLFPGDLLRNLTLMHQDYYGCRRGQRRIWQGVKEKVNQWHDSYRILHRQPASDPVLFYMDGGEFIVIRQRRHGQDDMSHRLKGTSREIYLFCQQRAPISKILARFPGFGEEKVLPFLRMMVGKRLMFAEGEYYLSLAVPLRGW
ncbi:MAG: RiPP maturation radical SAM C-methyltransferase [Deltaproteobacteria bacterium]|nr:RiPP maturation radical SAM C-methyltransferase [Deltaproteobacteria bacterium]MBW2136800.1 RiPP maturation radical SAM C-methyltransferase [Deltaproteobacteria bacterium]